MMAWRMALAAVLVLAAALSAGCSQGADGALGGASAAESRAFHAQVRTARADGVRLAYYERGQGAPLVMLMGSGSTMSEWDPALLRDLARSHRLIVFDYRGIGLSGGRPHRRIEQMADDTDRLMGALGLDSADVLGWSLGGFVAQQLAIRHPERVDRLVLAATNPGGSRTVLGDPSDTEVDSDPDATDEEILRVNYPSTRAGRAAARAFLRRLERAADSGEIPDDFRVSDRAFNAQLVAEDAWLRSDRNYASLGIRVPTLVAGGARDLLVPPANLRRIARRIPGARLVLFRGAGHAFLFQAHERFALLIDGFLR